MTTVSKVYVLLKQNYGNFKDSAMGTSTSHLCSDRHGEAPSAGTTDLQH
jgi:hypothetical protein